jgi:ubiquinone/menaquinone biosynthesis C-methylase UbiE
MKLQRKEVLSTERYKKLIEKQEWEIYKGFRRYSRNPLIRVLNWKRHERVYKIIGNVNENKLILDLGCGDGVFTRMLSCKSNAVVGMDISAEDLKKARDHCSTLNNNSKIIFAMGDVTSTKFDDNSFDIIICTSVLEHILDLDAVLREIKRLLKKDGFAVIGYPIETRLMLTFLRTLWPESNSFKTWFNPKKMSIGEFNSLPQTHKQNYKNIRKSITRFFQITSSTKIPLKLSPDFLSYYEICKLRIKTTN